jgi:hypothetical protein
MAFSAIPRENFRGVFAGIYRNSSSTLCVCVVTCRYRMLSSEAADMVDGLQIWKIAASGLNEQLWAAEKCALYGGRTDIHR